MRELESRVAELGRAPVTSDQMSDRLSTMLSLATAEAAAIRDAALSAADRVRTEADEETWRLRETAAAELSDVRARAAAVRTEHTVVLAAARTRAEEIVRAAQRQARALDEEAARRREQIDEDFRLASDLRRSESLREERERHDAAVAAADATRREAHEEARRIVDRARDEARAVTARARAHVEELRDLRLRVVGDLTAIRARLEPVPGTEGDDVFELPPEPGFSSSDE